ncbi:MAG: hypothetical protein H6Q13_2452 [Bacteroidetes bacterium]|jgi:hypothetical protein|nr:hypothetical protein [Bacteroidota bacterium]
MRYIRKQLLFRKLAASTLLETIIASVIFMIIFVMAMDTLTRLMTFDNEDADYIVIENELRKCKRLVCLNELRSEAKTFTYDWGEIDVEISNYKENIYQVNMVAVTTNQHRKISYRFLKAN